MVLGHSVGEIAAAQVAGAIGLEAGAAVHVPLRDADGLASPRRKDWRFSTASRRRRRCSEVSCQFLW